MEFLWIVQTLFAYAQGLFVAVGFTTSSARWTTETVSSWASTIPGWSDPAPSPSRFEFVPLLEFYEHNYRELVEEDLPVKACTGQREPAPFFRRPFVISRLRLTPDGWPEPNMFGVLPTMTLHRTLPERGFCKWLGASEIPYVSWMITSSWFCEDCRHRPCAKAVGFVPGTHQLTVDLPPGDDACVWIDKMPSGAHTMRVAWEQHLDLWVFGRLLLGALLVWNYVVLRESTVLHSAMGGGGSLGVLTMMAMMWFYSSMRSVASGSVPLGGFFTSLGMLLCVLVPSVGQALVSVVTPSSGADLWAWLNFSIYNVPVGWIVAVSTVAIIFKTISIGACWSVMYFASPPEPEGDVAFEIGRDGRRVDLGLPPLPISQRCLGGLIWMCGLALLLHSTYSEGCSLSLTLVVLFKDFIFSIFSRGTGRLRHGAQLEPHQLHPRLMSIDAYEMEGKMHTVAALAQLRNYIREEGLYAIGREDSELRLRRFSEGRDRFGSGHMYETEDIHKTLERERRLSSLPNPYLADFDMHVQPVRRRCHIL